VVLGVNPSTCVWRQRGVGGEPQHLCLEANGLFYSPPDEKFLESASKNKILCLFASGACVWRRIGKRAIDKQIDKSEYTRA